jgi:hypothetical protein
LSLFEHAEDAQMANATQKAWAKRCSRFIDNEYTSLTAVTQTEVSSESGASLECGGPAPLCYSGTMKLNKNQAIPSIDVPKHGQVTHSKRCTNS